MCTGVSGTEPAPVACVRACVRRGARVYVPLYEDMNVHAHMAFFLPFKPPGAGATRVWGESIPNAQIVGGWARRFAVDYQHS